MRGIERPVRRRNSLYVKQNKAYQALLAALIVIFMVVAVVVISGTVSPNSFWNDNVFIRMIIERNSARYTRGQ